METPKKVVRTTEENLQRARAIVEKYGPKSAGAAKPKVKKPKKPAKP